MQTCPTCATELPVENRFCEECGTALHHAAEAAPAPAAQPCPKCHAAPEEIDVEGFCSACGFRREERGRDHFELVLSPWIAGVSDRGLRHHRNEDFLAIAEIPNKSAFAVVVCDGVSNSPDADLASKAAAEPACRMLGEQAEPDMIAVVQAAQDAVAAITCAVGPERPASTIVVAHIAAENAVIGWLGDSRAYWLNSAGARQISQDDSWLNEMLNELAAGGEPAGPDALKSPNAHAITRWLGADAPQDEPPHTLTFPIPGPGAILLCTDGLWNYAPRPEDIAGLIEPLEGREAIEITRGLIEFARSKGGHDNITAALIKVPFNVPDNVPADNVPANHDPVQS